MYPKATNAALYSTLLSKGKRRSSAETLGLSPKGKKSPVASPSVVAAKAMEIDEEH